METGDLKWLNARFVEKILQRAEKDNSIKVLNITLKSATSTGDNYLSNLQRIIIEFSRNQKGHRIMETRSVVAKIQLPSVAMEELLTDIGAFETERSMLLETLPRIDKMLVELNAPPLTARCLYVQNENPIHVMMEDLAIGGYRMFVDRCSGVDLNHCLLVFRYLAAFHAGSVALAEKDPEAVRIYKRPIFNKDCKTLGDGLFNANTRSLAEQATSWPDLNPRIAEKVLHLSSCILEKACEACRFSEDDFNVINHGDLSSNNVMFRYDDRSKPIDVKFVDFQFSYYGSPAVDVLYFLGTIASEEVRFNHRELLLREYHDSLISTMAKLKCKTEAPSFEKLQETLGKRAAIEVASSFGILPLVLVDRSQVTTINDKLGLHGKVENRDFHGCRMQQVMTKILKLYDRMGLLEL